ncbi:MAG: carboxylating nicotinate-nucleotide diphosphorylase [Phycisphaerae bacterium]
MATGLQGREFAEMRRTRRAHPELACGWTMRGGESFVMSVSDDESVARLIAAARAEDLGDGDITTGLLDDVHERASFNLVAKAGGVFAGRGIAAEVLRAYDDSIEIAWTDTGKDGALIKTPPAQLASVHGPLGPVLSAERVLLNFLQRLSGIATLTRQFVDAVAGTGAAILDTRKTTPGWRMLEKYAVRCGGGTNHRMGLYDAVLIKDNHLTGINEDRLAATVFGYLNRLSQAGNAPAFIAVEADTPRQVEELLKVVGIDVIVLDNFPLAAVRQAVALRDEAGLRGTIALEASGGVTPVTARALAETGVDRISVGSITHSAPAVDISLERA